MSYNWPGNIRELKPPVLINYLCEKILEKHFLHCVTEAVNTFCTGEIRYVAIIEEGTPPS